MADETKKTPFYGNRGTANSGRPEFERWEVTVSGTGGDSEAVAKKVAAAVKGTKDADDLTVTYREPGSGANVRTRDMLADDEDREGDAKEAEKQEKQRLADAEKENEKAKDRGVSPMPTPEERVAGTTAAREPVNRAASGTTRSTGPDKKSGK